MSAEMTFGGKTYRRNPNGDRLWRRLDNGYKATPMEQDMLAEIDTLRAQRDETIPKLSIRTAMARAGLANGQRDIWYDYDDRRHDPLTERDNVAHLLAELAALAGEV